MAIFPLSRIEGHPRPGKRLSNKRTNVLVLGDLSFPPDPSDSLRFHGAVTLSLRVLRSRRAGFVLGPLTLRESSPWQSASHFLLRDPGPLPSITLGLQGLEWRRGRGGGQQARLVKLEDLFPRSSRQQSLSRRGSPRPARKALEVAQADLGHAGYGHGLAIPWAASRALRVTKALVGRFCSQEEFQNSEVNCNSRSKRRNNAIFLVWTG